MTAHTIIPPASARACINCTAWRLWDSITVGRETPDGFVVIGKKPTGQCRAAPPSIDSDAIGAGTAAWPVVEADDWCRSFERRETTSSAEAA